jgi:hypothetical protein
MRLRRLADWPANDRGSASGDTIAVSPHSIDPLLQGRSPKGDSARHFVRAMPDWCAPCPFRARRARFGILSDRGL